MATLCRLDVFLLFTFSNIISNSRLQVLNVGGKDFAEIRMCGSLRMVPDSLWAMMLLNM